MTPEADKFWLDKAKEDRRKERNMRRTVINPRLPDLVNGCPRCGDHEHLIIREYEHTKMDGTIQKRTYVRCRRSSCFYDCDMVSRVPAPLLPEEWKPLLFALAFIAGFLLLILLGNWLAGGDPGMPTR